MSNSRIEVKYVKVANADSYLLGQRRWLEGGKLYASPEGGIAVSGNDSGWYPTDLNRDHWQRDHMGVVGVSVVRVVTPQDNSQAYKADDGKPNWFLLMSAQGCAKALAGVVRVLSFAVRSKDKGGKGYAEHSWRQVPNAKERYQAALYRHLNKLERGETHDDESGESHWYHVATNALFLAELHNAEEKQ